MSRRADIDVDAALPWVLRALWVALPFTLGAQIGDALEGTSRPVQLTGTVGAWTLWGLGLLLTLVPHTLTLSPLRVLAPAAFGVAVWAALADGVSGWTLAALAVTAGVAAVVMSPAIGGTWINGSSYGDERRVPLRAPGPMVAGPIPLAWAAVVSSVAAGALLLAAKQWILGFVVAVLAVGLVVVVGRALHQLTQRWLVFVPAGLVVHDHLSVGDPVLFKRTAIAAFGPALADTSAADLTAGATGLALEILVKEPVEIGYRPQPGARPTVREIDGVAIAPSRPGVVLAEARRRNITVA
ncbi:MAG: hypothetical protein AAF480_19320 [Actinomycetota bacterium]